MPATRTPQRRLQVGDRADVLGPVLVAEGQRPLSTGLFDPAQSELADLGCVQSESEAATFGSADSMTEVNEAVTAAPFVIEDAVGALVHFFSQALTRIAVGDTRYRSPDREGAVPQTVPICRLTRCQVVCVAAWFAAIKSWGCVRC